MALWTPAKIATSLWLDAADDTTVVRTGSEVTRWKDKSSGNDCVQVGATTKPIYTANGFNGLGCLTFDGTDDFLYSLAGITSGTYTGDFNVFWVATNTANGGTIITERASANVVLSQWLNYFGTPYISSNGATVGSNHRIGLSNYNLLSASGGVVSHFHTADIRDRLWLNGLSIPVLDGTATNINGSAGYRIGAREGSAGQRWPGKIMEILVLARTVSTTERQVVEGYLAWKWGLQANLPADHPYKNAAPLVGKYDVNGKKPVSVWIPSLDTAGNGTTTLTDLVGSSNGTLTNMDAATDWVADTDAGGVRALDFDGVNDSVVAAGTSLTVASGFSISCWVKVASNSQSGSFVKIGPSGFGTNTGLSIGVGNGTMDTNGNELVVARERIAWHPTGDMIPLAWAHVGISYTTAASTVYLNGVAVLTFSGGISESPATLAGTAIGGQQSEGSPRFANIRMDDVRVWNQPLLVADFQYLYAGGFGRGIRASVGSSAAAIQFFHGF